MRVIGFVVERSRERSRVDLDPYRSMSVIRRCVSHSSPASTSGRGDYCLFVHVTGQGFINLPDTVGADPCPPGLYNSDGFRRVCFHRAQHSISPLWAMHSLHHSDPDVMYRLPLAITGRAFYKVSHYISAVGIIFKATRNLASIR